MTTLQKIKLLQKLAIKLDSDQGTALEQECFDCILETVYEQNKNRFNDWTRTGDYFIWNGHFSR